MLTTDIPRPIKLAARKRCGFACVECGSPIIEYHHEPPRHEVQEHRADQIILLCPTHHAEATKGLFTREQVLSANASPYALSAGKSDGYHAKFSGKECGLVVGGLTARATFLGPGRVIPIWHLRTAPIEFQFDDGHLLLSLNLRDRHNNQLLSIVENELTFAASNYDVEWVGRSITVRSGHEKIALEIQLNPPDEVRVIRGLFWHSGSFVKIAPGLVTTPMGNRVDDCSVTAPVGAEIKVLVGLDVYDSQDPSGDIVPKNCFVPFQIPSARGLGLGPGGPVDPGDTK